MYILACGLCNEAEYLFLFIVYGGFNLFIPS